MKHEQQFRREDNKGKQRRKDGGRVDNPSRHEIGPTIVQSTAVILPCRS